MSDIHDIAHLIIIPQPLQALESQQMLVPVHQALQTTLHLKLLSTRFDCGDISYQ